MEMKDKWRDVEEELMAAYALLSDDVVESDHGYRNDDFVSYINSNQFLLAMEELDGVIEDNPSPGKEF